jgi:hypothetical protein
METVMGKTLYNQVRLKGRFSLAQLNRMGIIAAAGAGMGAVILALMLLP